MKKILTLLTVLSLSFTAASAEDTFNYDEQNLNKEFSQLNKIENYVGFLKYSAERGDNWLSITLVPKDL